ncbi:hypothetical protein OGAPHI_002023 [Ogataea philodendri]|uniref:Uncharacterized protein n=1 Tax=Ogataea philodendri TaxID=1378263 RepID=A0A9P8T7A5_9ASCO|nr:uncharacterized protein OGAPHI_002023 [Ogataea philodendri]KAH3668269.1 hypothetical protein OGAPHI_002023 [Ogataea philodendri]
MSNRFLSCQTCNKLLGVVTKSNHTNGLPNSKHNSWSHTSIKSLYTVVRVDVFCSTQNAQILWTFRITCLGLHLHTDHLNWLVPGRKTTTQSRRQNSLASSQLLVLRLSGERLDGVLSESGQPESRSPVGHLSNCNSIDTLVDTLDTFLGVDVLENFQAALDWGSSSSSLVSGDLDSLHTGTESHCEVSLEQSTSDSSTNTRNEWRCAHSLQTVLSFGRHKQQNSTFGTGFNPGPRNQSLVESKYPSSGPNHFGGLKNRQRTVGSHCSLDHFERLTQGGHLEHVETCSKQDVGEGDWFFLNLGHICKINNSKKTGEKFNHRCAIFYIKRKKRLKS